MKKSSFAVSGLAALLACVGFGTATADDSGVYSGPSDVEWASCGLDEFPGCEAALLQGDPSNGAYAMYVRMPPGAAFTPHWHSNAHYLVGVEGTLTFVWADGTEAALSPGKFLYWPGGERMEGRCGDDGPCVYYDQQTDFGDVHFYDE